MSYFTVTNTISLRSNYSANRALSSKSARTDISPKTLTLADSAALKKAIRSLGDFDFENSDEKELGSKIKAFVDTYNFTLQSSTKTSMDASSIKSTVKSMKALTANHKSDLENLGISFSSDGYMSLSATATENISGDKFSKVFGADSSYMKSLKQVASHLGYKVDTYI